MARRRRRYGWGSRWSRPRSWCWPSTGPTAWRESDDQGRQGHHRPAYRAPGTRRLPILPAAHRGAERRGEPLMLTQDQADAILQQLDASTSSVLAKAQANVDDF